MAVGRKNGTKVVERYKAERTRQVQWAFDKPGLDLREPLHIVNSLRDIPNLVRINHKHIPRWPRVLSFDAARARGFPSLRQVGGVVNDGAGDLPAAGGPTQPWS